MEKIPNDEIEKIVKELSKQSTAPDKETPDWMEADIRRGAIAGYSLSQTEIESLRKQNEELGKRISELQGENFDQFHTISELQSEVERLTQDKMYLVNQINKINH